MTLCSGTRIGHYEVRTRVGLGGMGEVYRARDLRLGRDVALKTLPESLVKDSARRVCLEREAQALAACNHPNIAAIYGLEEFNGTLAIAMELVDGPTLADRIASGPMGIEEALCVARGIAEALEVAHEKGIVHR